MSDARPRTPASPGDTVYVEFDDGEIVNLRLVTPHLGMPGQSETTTESPLGAALLGSYPGTVLNIEVAGTSLTVKVIDVVTGVPSP
ncbi:MAG: GreA/GreB family elongation factor [Acidimicrobiales bacterium]|nr:GreA/GreB family elongation factor [Acidimicrobiales bacterium]